MRTAGVVRSSNCPRRAAQRWASTAASTTSSTAGSTTEQHAYRGAESKVRRHQETSTAVRVLAGIRMAAIRGDRSGHRQRRPAPSGTIVV